MSTFGPQYKTGIDKLQRGQQRVTKKTSTWNACPVMRGWGSWELFSLKKRQLQWDSQLPTTTFDVVTEKTETGYSKWWVMRGQHTTETKTSQIPAWFKEIKKKQPTLQPNPPNYTAIRQWKQGPGRLQSPFSEVFKTQLNKALSNWIWSCFEQEVELETSWSPFQPELLNASVIFRQQTRLSSHLKVPIKQGHTLKEVDSSVSKQQTSFQKHLKWTRNISLYNIISFSVKL